MRPFVLPLLASLLFLCRAAAAQEPSCAVDRHAGFTDQDAEAVEQVLCPELAARLPGENRVRIAQLGAKVVVNLASTAPNGAPRPPAQILLSSLDEIPVATPRLVQAAEGTPIAETVDVTNVVGSEARPYKKKSGFVNVWLGTEALMSTASGAGGGAGFSTTIGLGAEHWMFVGDLRLGGGHDVSRFGLASGVRYLAGTGDVSPFVGVAFGFQTVSIHGADGTGAGASAEAGVDFLRTHKFGGAVALRLDMPLFAVDQTDYTSDSYGSYYGPSRTTVHHYQAPVVSAGVAMRF